MKVIDSTVTTINDLLKKGFVVQIWTTKNNLIGYKVSIDDRSNTIYSSSPKQIFVKEMLLDMIKNGTRKNKKGCVDFLIYVDRMGKYSIVDHN